LEPRERYVSLELAARSARQQTADMRKRVERPEHRDGIGDAWHRVAAVDEAVGAIAEDTVVAGLEMRPARPRHAESINRGRRQTAVFDFLGGQNGEGRAETVAGEKDRARARLNQRREFRFDQRQAASSAA
jgi:hypothetical protein